MRSDELSLLPEGIRGNEDAHDIVRWAAALEHVAVVTSFQSTGLVILHLMRQFVQDIPVLFLNTGFHFAETTDFVHTIATQWDLNLVELRGAHESPERQTELHGPELYRRDPDLCCSINKVRPLQEALEGYDGWLTGLRRDQSLERAGSQGVEVQQLPSGKRIFKIHPLVGWTKEEVATYTSRHRIPTHPLLERGYESVGCWPCTAADNGSDRRAARWIGFEKTECGIHTFGRSQTVRQKDSDATR